MSGRARAVLLVSLGLNLALGGALLGHLLAGEQRALGRRVAAELVGEVPEPMRPVLRANLWARRAPMLEAVREIRAARAAARAAARTEPLDRDALEAALARLRAATAQAQQTLHDGLVSALIQTPAPTRREWLERSMMRRLAAGPGLDRLLSDPPQPPSAPKSDRP